MRTASVRDIRQNFPRVMAWIADGEQVAITMRRKVVARLVPERPPERRKPTAPDFAAISREIFGDRTFQGDAVEAEREGYKY
ncbi:MAG: type II toxin-antitoxin system Phd/YefM family antitoxin [Terrimicrobiaceae bacterium]